MKTRKLLGQIGWIGLIAVGAVGCSLNHTMPHTTLSATIGGQVVRLDTPKDYEVRGLKIEVATNGVATVNIASLRATMNPSNTVAAGAAETAIINATAAAVATGMSAASAAAGTAAAAAAK